MEREHGTVTLWVLGLCIALMFLGGLSLDLWRAVADRRELSGMADAAATAGANGVDESSLRSGHLRLDPVRARALALATLNHFPHASQLDRAVIDIGATRITVTLRDHVDFSLLDIFMPRDQFTVEAHGVSEPREGS
jgi:Flp pilus assembly protein TadG